MVTDSSNNRPTRLILAEIARTTKFGSKAPAPCTIWRWERKGDIPKSFKIGGLRFFNEDELDAAIAKRAAGQ